MYSHVLREQQNVEGGLNLGVEGEVLITGILFLFSGGWAYKWAGGGGGGGREGLISSYNWDFMVAGVQDSEGLM